MTAQALASGTRLHGGAYRLAGLIGAGGFGMVYKAANRRGKVVAIKELFPSDARRQRVMGFWQSRRVRPTANWGQLQGQMRDEFRLVQPLRHPNIVRAIELFGDNGTLYLVMEYIDGENLQARLRRAPHGLPPREVARLAAALGSALDYAHKRGVLHRDIKPANVLLRRNGEPVLADFGLAAALDGVTRERSGTTATMAPEQSAGRPQGPAADVYALGATLSHALTGSPPQSADERQREDLLPLPGDTNLARAIYHALILDPDRRTRSASAFLRELNGGKEPAARPKARRASRGWARGVLLALGLGAVAAAWSGCPGAKSFPADPPRDGVGK